MMSGYYAARDQVSRDPIDGGIEITAEQYREGIDAILDPEKVVRVDGGVFSVEPKPQPVTYWLAADDQRKTDPGEDVPEGGTTTPPPSPYHSLVDGAWSEDADALGRADRSLCARIDAKASEARGRFISSGTGQSAVYLTKYEEARAYQGASDPVDSDYPYLAAEAGRRNMTVSALAQEVIDTRNAWTDPAGATIEAERVGGKADVRSATSVADKQAAADAAIATLEQIAP